MRSKKMGLAVFVGTLALGACKRGPSDEELEQKFAAWQKKQATAVVPSSSASDLADGSMGALATAQTARGSASPTGNIRSDSLYESKCLPDAAQGKSKETAKLLVELEKLMANYRPTLPTLPDAPEKCLTKVAESNDPAGAKVEGLFAAEYKKQADEARQKAAEIQRHFDDVDLPLAWTWVSAIVPGHEFALMPDVLVKEPTELMKRLATRPDLKVDATQHCLVAQAVVTGDTLVLDCRGPRRGDDELFHVEVEKKAGAAGGTLATVGVGDLVSFSEQLLLTHRPRGSRRTLRWVFQSVPAENVKIAAESTCCHPGAK